MNGKESSNIYFLITLAAGIIGSILIGLIFGGLSIFQFMQPSFAVLVYGITGSLVFSALKYKNIRDSIFFALFALILDLILIKAMPVSFIVRDVLLFVAIWFSIFFYWLLLKYMTEKYIFIRALALGAISAVMLVIAGFSLILINIRYVNITSTLLYQVLFFYLRTGIITGLGMGLGFDAAEIMIKRRRENPESRRQNPESRIQNPE